jgi:hypothetical protein
MDDPMTKAQLIERVQQERADWEALLAEVGEARMTRPGVTGDWTFKDVAAHLTAWRMRAIVRLLAAQRGEAPPPPPWAALLAEAGDDFEPINQWIYRENRDRPLAEVLRKSRESLQQLEAAVQALPEQDLIDPQRFPWMKGTSLGEMMLGNSIDHFYTEHAPALRAWLNELSAG